ncbi:hypothetical protein [Streptomyces sp. NBC_01789]|uniref:hypothetical protein n=1 Tax=Streptomyces sp. NBC_01789 TaxID=2975941 RepID=UPI00225756F0|nr:hypothetical protein [Streptomyces sp. NBC_01789]MCX4451726.1 hypothetical protein [Streptomyces sp. NBC_01789]
MISVDLLPVVVTDLPDDEDHAPLLVDPGAARVVRADRVAAGDTVLAAFPEHGPRGRMVVSDYFNDQYRARPVAYDPACCEFCRAAADRGPVVNLGDVNPWGVCDLWGADAPILVVPAA